MCCVHRVDDTTSGKCDCSGTNNVHVARYEMVVDSNDLIELSNFKSISEECGFFFSASLIGHSKYHVERS